MNKQILILLGVLLIVIIAVNPNLPFAFWQSGQTINVEYGSNVEIWNTLVNPYDYNVEFTYDIFRDGRLYDISPRYYLYGHTEVEISFYDYAITENHVYDIRYKFTEDVGYETYRVQKTEAGSVRYIVKVSKNKNDIEIEPPFLPSPVDISDEVDIPDPVYDDSIQANIVVTKPSPLSSGKYEVLVDDKSTGNITNYKLYQDDKVLYQGGNSFRSYRAYIDPGQISVFMIEVSNSGRVSTAYAVAETTAVPVPPEIKDFGMVASISSSNVKPYGNGYYSVDIVDNSKGNIDYYILYEDDMEIYRGSSSFGTRNQLIPAGDVSIFMIEIQNEKAVATAYTVVDTTEVNIPSFSMFGSLQNANMIILGLVALFVIWAFAGFKRPF